jgi:hypothetical protein
MDNNEMCCPACKGTSGMTYEMTETHSMYAPWGGMGEAGDSGFYVKQSLVACRDCGTRFRYEALARKGLIDPDSRGAR